MVAVIGKTGYVTQALMWVVILLLLLHWFLWFFFPNSNWLKYFIKINRFEHILFQTIWRKFVKFKRRVSGQIWIDLELCASAHSGNEADHWWQVMYGERYPYWNSWPHKIATGGHKIQLWFPSLLYRSPVQNAQLWR